MRGRPDVGQRNHNFSGSRDRRNNPDSFAREGEFAGATVARIEQNRRPAARCFEAGGHLEMASDPKIAVLDVAGGARQIRAADLCATLSDYWALTKPEVNFSLQPLRVSIWRRQLPQADCGPF
jgi:hypothetical protein